MYPSSHPLWQPFDPTTLKVGCSVKSSKILRLISQYRSYQKSEEEWASFFTPGPMERKKGKCETGKDPSLKSTNRGAVLPFVNPSSQVGESYPSKQKSKTWSLKVSKVPERRFLGRLRTIDDLRHKPYLGFKSSPSSLPLRKNWDPVLIEYGS